MTLADLVKDRTDGQTLRQLATKAGVSEATMSRWLSGDNVPEDWRVPALAELFLLEEESVARVLSYSRQLRGHLKGPPPDQLRALRQEVADLRARVEELEKGKPRGARR